MLKVPKCVGMGSFWALDILESPTPKVFFIIGFGKFFYGYVTVT